MDINAFVSWVTQIDYCIAGGGDVYYIFTGEEDQVTPPPSPQSLW